MTDNDILSFFGKAFSHMYDEDDELLIAARSIKHLYDCLQMAGFTKEEAMMLLVGSMHSLGSEKEL